MKLRGPHLVCLLAALLVLGAGLRWFLRGNPLDGPRPAAGFSGGPFLAEAPTRAPQSFLPWNPPTAQSAGREWIFEVFTPPIIFYDPATRQFTLRPPLEPEPAPIFGLDVDGIERVPYRLQFAGYHGEPGRFLVELHDVEAGVFYRGRAGDRFPDGEFALRRFVADTRRVQPPDRPWATPYLETFLEVEVEDQRLGQTVRFGRDPLYLPDPVAILLDTVSGATAKVFAGDSWETAEGRFTVEAIDRAAGTVTVAKYARTGTFLERRTFTAESGAESAAP